jgi:meso-butanediol dehydrogenase / (S,S)-butanediol dehydrogenase / diacetyl reductase
VTDTSSGPTLVTGAAGAIGAAIVDRIVNSQATPGDAAGTVLALDHDADALDELVSRYPEGAVRGIHFDLADLDATPDFLDKLIQDHAPIRRIVLNAGVWDGAPITQMPDDVWQLNFAINVTSPFMFLRQLVPPMARAGGGAIVCTASRNAHRSSTNNAAYDASKAALLGLVRTASGEFACDHIRINAVSPGVVSTPSTAEIEEEPFRSAYLRKIPMDRYGRPDDIAGVCLFLLSHEAGYITGQDLIVDGGQIACQDNGRLLD